MRFYTLYVPYINPKNLSQGESYLGHQIENLIPIKEGFCWPAFFFSMFWAAWHRLWLSFAGLIALYLFINLLLILLEFNQNVILLVDVAISFLFGGIANDLRRLNLEGSGYSNRSVVVASTREQAVQRHLKMRSRRP